MLCTPCEITALLYALLRRGVRDSGVIHGRGSEHSTADGGDQVRAPVASREPGGQTTAENGAEGSGHHQERLKTLSQEPTKSTVVGAKNA